MSADELFGPYRLEELIGRGGMGEVYRAHDTRRDRVVALKILLPALATPKFEARFERESRMVARLSAPHIVPIHDYGEINGRLFLDMRLVRGVDLGTVLESGPLPAPRAVEMTAQVASALDAAHADGLVHRDVKPSNVLYEGDPRQRRLGVDRADFVYLVDFGVARSLEEESSLTATGHAVGTLGYMAPERFSGAPADRRADVYALACTLYEALTGRPAFDGVGLAQLMFDHLHRTPTPLHKVDRTLPEALDDVLAAGMAKDPDERYSSAGRLAEAARSALGGDPPRGPTRTLRTAAPDPRRDPNRSRPPPRAPGDQHPDRPSDAGPAAPGAANPVPALPTRAGRTSPRRRRVLQLGGAAMMALALLTAAVVGVRTFAAPESGPVRPLSTCGTDPLTCNATDPDALRSGGELTVAVDADVASWNVAAPAGALGPTRWVMGSVLPHTFTVAPDFTRTLNTDLLADARLTDPTTIVYTIRPTARWDDGTPVGPDDFTLNWRMRNGRDCPGCFSDQAGYNRITDVTGAPTPDGGHTVVVRLDAPYPDWPTLFASTSPLYPAHLARRQGNPGSPAGLQAAYDWFGATVPGYSAGPLAVQDWRPGQAVVLTRNPGWYGRPARLDRVVLQVTPDPAAQLQALLADRVQVIAPYAQAGMAAQLAGAPGVAYYAGAGLAWERIDLNLRTPALRPRALRQALFTAIDLARVRAIGAEVFGAAEPMGGHLLVPGQPGYRDLLAGTGQGSGELAAARRILSEAGYTGVGTALIGPDGTPVGPLRGAYATVHPARPRIADYVAGVARGLGLTVTMTPIPAGGSGDALTGGRFDLMVGGWAVPPAPVADAQQSWTSGGAANYSGCRNAQADRLIDGAAASPDPATAGELLDQADRLLTQEACVLPLFRRPTVVAVRQDVANVRDNAVAGPLYNVADWGVRD